MKTALIDPARKYVEPDPLTPTLSQKERERSAVRKINHFSDRINKAGGNRLYTTDHAGPLKQRVRHIEAVSTWRTRDQNL